VGFETGYDGSHVMNMNHTNHDNNINYSKDQEYRYSRDPRLTKNTNISAIKTEDQDYNSYNGKSRDNRLTTVHEDTREAMGTEDMEISNSP